MKSLRVVLAVVFAVGIASGGFAEVLWAVGPGNVLVSFDYTAPAAPLLSGDSFGFDFEPTVDRIRVVSQSDLNSALHPELGWLVATDSTRDALDRQDSLGGSPSSLIAGSPVTIGPIGVITREYVGFDIQSASGTASAALHLDGASELPSSTARAATACTSGRKTDTGLDAADPSFPVCGENRTRFALNGCDAAGASCRRTQRRSRGTIAARSSIAAVSCRNE